MKETKQQTTIYRSYKDRVFRMVFQKKEKLLELYNALNSTQYTDAAELTINTLENAIFIKMKNDVSFIIDCEMCLYEHQSTYCPNMPLRGFLYFADLYKKLTKDLDLSVRTLIKIPTPQYVVFYNGLECGEESFVQRLSDAFEDGKGCMELTVKTYNINLNQNRSLMEKCPSLYGYAYFVNEVRQNLKEQMEMRDAVEQAVDSCIAEDVLTDFFTEQKAEVVSMSIYEYNEEYVRKSFMEEGRREGRREGHREGVDSGMMSAIRNIMESLHLTLEQAMSALMISDEKKNVYRKMMEK